MPKVCWKCWLKFEIVALCPICQTPLVDWLKAVECYKSHVTGNVMILSLTDGPLWVQRDLFDALENQCEGTEHSKAVEVAAKVVMDEMERSGANQLILLGEPANGPAI